MFKKYHLTQSIATAVNFSIYQNNFENCFSKAHFQNCSKIKKNSYIFQKKNSYISENGTPYKNILIFQEGTFWTRKIKKTCSEKISYISGNGTLKLKIKKNMF